MTVTALIPAPRTPDPADRWEIVTRAQQGDTAAFGELYELYAPKVHAFIWRRTGDRHLAEDLTGDVFVRALRNLGGLSWQGRDPGAWLITIARNIVVDYFKSHRYRRELTVEDVRDSVDRLDESPEGDPASAVADHFTNLTLLAAVTKLVPEQQECIRLRFLCGYSVTETAQAMGKQEGAVRALTYRATKALGRLLDGQGIGPDAPPRRRKPAPPQPPRLRSGDELIGEYRRRTAAVAR